MARSVLVALRVWTWGEASRGDRVFFAPPASGDQGTLRPGSPLQVESTRAVVPSTVSLRGGNG